MQNLKNLAVGFIVSFLGSIPLGYLNVVGFHLFQKSGLHATILYLLGVMVIEFFVIYFTLLFAQKLADNKRLTKIIQIFSILFMFVLAFLFYFGAQSKTNYSQSFAYAPFVLGLVLSGFNFVNIPFWTGWNLYLIHSKYIEITGIRKYGYVLGTLVGTFCGMLLLIYSLHYFAANVAFMAKYLLKYIIPMVFFGLGLFQSLQFYKKYRLA